MTLKTRIEKLERLSPVAAAPVEYTDFLERLYQNARAKWENVPDDKAPREWLRVKELLQLAQQRKAQGAR